MPRHTLDRWVYKIKTMDVCLTKHKEDDIYTHMIKMHEKAQTLFEKYNAKYETILKELDDDENHMYAKYNWKLGEPSRFWKKHANEWYIVDVADDDKEIVQNEIKFLYEIWADFQLCNKYSSEWCTEKADWISMTEDIDNIHTVLKNVSDTIRVYEATDYVKYKSKWERENKQWIEENKQEKEHIKSHSKIQLPSPTNRDKVPDPYPEKPLVDDCIHCKKHWEEMRIKYDTVIEMWIKNKQEWDNYLKQQEIENEKKRVKRERAVKQFVASLDIKEDLHCHICDYEAKDDLDLYDHRQSSSHKKNSRYCKVCSHQCRTDEEFEDHLETLKHKNKEEGIEVVEKSKEDIKKSRYCEICNIQCRNDADYAHHVETTKHKKNAGLIEKVKIYKCEHCDYQTTIKCNFEKHIVAKNH